MVGEGEKGEAAAGDGSAASDAGDEAGDEAGGDAAAAAGVLGAGGTQRAPPLSSVSEVQPRFWSTGHSSAHSDAMTCAVRMRRPLYVVGPVRAQRNAVQPNSTTRVRVSWQRTFAPAVLADGAGARLLAPRHRHVGLRPGRRLHPEPLHQQAGQLAQRQVPPDAQEHLRGRPDVSSGTTKQKNGGNGGTIPP